MFTISVDRRVNTNFSDVPNSHCLFPLEIEIIQNIFDNLNTPPPPIGLTSVSINVLSKLGNRKGY
jgi:hypothetical protein